MSSPTPVIAIVGRPNVGKSTIFNRFVGYGKAIVDGTPGVTRDRNYHTVSLGGRIAHVIDTGGFEPVSLDDLKRQILEQTMLAIEEADVILLVCDARSGINPADEEVARILRTSEKETIVVVNKIDEPIHESLIADFFSLGFSKVLSVSAEHKIGLDNLKESIEALLPMEEKPDPDRMEEIVRLSVVGRPNTGKSSLINKIFGAERIIVNKKAGTTRDSIDTAVRVNDRDYLFIDTAGIRKKRRVSMKLEKYSVIMALKNIDRSDIAILMVDARDGVGTQESKIASQIDEMGKGCILALNKWDLVEKETRTFQEYSLKVREKLPFMGYAPVVSISALTGQRVDKLFPLIDQVHENCSFRISTSEVTKLFEEAMRKKPPPMYRGKAARMFFATQTGVRPPTFVCFVNNPDALPTAYRRYIENQIRQAYPFEGSPLRVLFKARERR